MQCRSSKKEDRVIAFSLKTYESLDLENSEDELQCNYPKTGYPGMENQSNCIGKTLRYGASKNGNWFLL
jgi:hypothetical protein